MPSVSRLDKACRALGLTVRLGKNLNLTRENQGNTYAAKEHLKSRLKEADVTELAKITGVPRRSINSIIEEKGVDPSLTRAENLVRGLGLELYIGPPRGDDRPVLSASIETHTQGLVRAVHAAGGDPIPPHLRGALAGEAADEPPGARPVDVVELACAAGGGAEVLSEDVIGRLWFRRDWLDEHGLDATQCAVLGVHGDSMRPTLAAGAKILINRANRQRRTNRIYVIRTDDGVIVKRLGKAGAKDWCLVSDNEDKTAWPTIAMPPQAEIIGQVVWTARTLL